MHVGLGQLVLLATNFPNFPPSRKPRVVLVHTPPKPCSTTDAHVGPSPQGCPPFTHLTLTGGAIGSGPPMALGAAIALAEAEGEAQGSQEPPRQPGAQGAGARRRVVNLQADGSAMYSLQVGC